MVSNYKRPRDVKRIVDGFKNNAQIPLSIILKGSNGTHSMTGNTRQSVARVLGYSPRAILIDVSKNK